MPPQGAPGGSGQLGTRMEAQSLGAQPLPLVLERAASKAADVTAFDHSGAGGDTGGVGRVPCQTAGVAGLRSPVQRLSGRGWPQLLAARSSIWR